MREKKNMAPANGSGIIDVLPFGLRCAYRPYCRRYSRWTRRKQLFLRWYTEPVRSSFCPVRFGLRSWWRVLRSLLNPFEKRYFGGKNIPGKFWKWLGVKNLPSLSEKEIRNDMLAIWNRRGPKSRGTVRMVLGSNRPVGEFDLDHIDHILAAFSHDIQHIVSRWHVFDDGNVIRL